MNNSRSNINRDQLAAFLQDHRQVKQFESLFSDVSKVLPEEIVAAKLEAGNARNAAESALSQLDSLIDLIQLLVTMPPESNDNVVVADYVDLSDSGPFVNQPRRMQWDRSSGAPSVGVNDDVTLRLGQEIHYFARNNSGAGILRGTPVMFTGVVGSPVRHTFGLAVANGSIAADRMMGVTLHDIPDGTDGYVTSFGPVQGINTTGVPHGEIWNVGDFLYFSHVLPGTWTRIQPPAPNINVPVAIVTSVGPLGSGSIAVRMDISRSLSRLQDVHISGSGVPTAGQILIYDPSNARWQANNLTAGTGITIVNENGAITISANPITGASGSFSITNGTVTTVVTVVDGIITSIV